MKTKAELERAIIDISMEIHRDFPELVKYIDEMPEAFSGSDNDEIRAKQFREYYDSLKELFLEYSKTH